MNLFIKLNYILVLFISTINFSCTSDVCVETNLIEPIIFVGGYDSKADIWQKSGWIDELKQNGIYYAGHLSVEKNNQLSFEVHADSESKEDFYTVSFSDATADVEQLTEELEKMIEEVKKRTCSSTVNLVGYSMGGIICRNYTLKNTSLNDVKNVITIASPHQGTNIANVSYSLELVFGDYYNTAAEYAETIFPVSMRGKAISDLVSKVDNGFLSKINQQKHPTDVNYHFIAAKSTVCEHIGYYNGDLISSIESQCLQEALDKNLIKAKITLINNANHFDILLRKDEIINKIAYIFDKKVN